jgi:hypothetical protein
MASNLLFELLLSCLVRNGVNLLRLAAREAGELQLRSSKANYSHSVQGRPSGVE